jgi:hypothetical protein
MQSREQSDSRPQSRRELLVASVAAVAAAALIGTAVYITGQLQDLDEKLAGGDAGALPASVVAKGRAVYVPAYAHIYTGAGEPMLLATTLSVRNTDPEHDLSIDRVRYFDGDGVVLREFAEEPRSLAPMQTESYRIEQQDAAGGSGANFVVEWSADETINRPIIEAVMIGDAGVSFTSRGTPIDRR